MPGPRLRLRRRRAGMLLGSAISCGLAGWAMFQVGNPGPALVILANAALITAYWPRAAGRDGFWPRGGGRGPVFRGHSPESDAGRALLPLRWWPALSLASRLMPRDPGRRWLAEAESVLSETGAGRQRAAIRSYLRSAPQLVVTMWARELSHHARLRFRRPG